MESNVVEEDENDTVQILLTRRGHSRLATTEMGQRGEGIKTFSHQV